ncbi:MAG: hypothetical protein COZ05_15525, partial [Armatimonadetes bacterium CG_4_10_14_3_um_filter_59_10]
SEVTIADVPDTLTVSGDVVPATALNGNHDAITTNISVASTNGFAQTGYLRIDNEYLRYDFIAGNTFFGLQTRGQLGSAAAAHNDGAQVIPVQPVYGGQTNALVQRVTLTAGSGIVSVQRLWLMDMGAPNPVADVAQVRLYDDADASGTVNTGDVLSGSGIPFAGVNLDADPNTTGVQSYQVASGAPRTLLVVYDISPNAGNGDTLLYSIDSGVDVEVAAPDVVAEANFPITSTLLVVQ